MKIGLINNPLSRTNRARGLNRIAAIADARGVVCQDATDMVTMAPALRALADQGVNLVAINGGDGTVREALTQIWRERPFETPPLLAILHGGRSNAIATDCGMSGAPHRALDRLLTAAENGGIASSVTERGLIRVEGCAGRGAQYGMLMMAGGAIPVIEHTRTRIDPMGLPAWASDALSFLSVVRRRIGGGEPSSGYALEARADGADLPFGCILVLQATTLDTTVLGSRTYWNAASGPIRVTMIAHPPKNLLRHAPGLMFGGESRDLPEETFFSRGVGEMTLSIEGRIALDGEFFESVPGEPLRLSARETARFVTL